MEFVKLLDFIYVFLTKAWLQKDVTKKIREYYKESSDIEGTLRRLPRYLVAERAIVSLPLQILHPYYMANILSNYLLLFNATSWANKDFVY